MWWRNTWLDTKEMTRARAAMARAPLTEDDLRGVVIFRSAGNYFSAAIIAALVDKRLAVVTGFPPTRIARLAQ